MPHTRTGATHSRSGASARVGLEGRPAVVEGELLTAVDDDRLDRAGAARAVLDGVPVAALADVAGHGDDLDAHLLDHPADGHRGVETSAVREDDALRHVMPTFW